MLYWTDRGDPKQLAQEENKELLGLLSLRAKGAAASESTEKGASR